jgi:hypothetical protein
MALVPSGSSDAAIGESNATLPILGGRFSLLRASVPVRVGIVIAIAAVLWLAVLWALH